MWFNVIKALQRIALSNTDKIRRENYPQVTNHKPSGLWYSFSLGQGWMRRNMTDYGWLGSYKYILYLDTSSLNILQIKNIEEAVKFYDEYTDRGKTYDTQFKWHKVSDKYDGIEILNYSQWATFMANYKEEKKHRAMVMFNGWDMDSGCIWNTQNLKVKKVRPIEERHYRRQHKEQNAWMDE